jgi:hypothetical protein
MSLHGLTNTRTTFQRFSDARLFRGWVTELSETELRVRAELPGEVQRGDWFRFTIFGYERDVHLSAMLRQIELEEVLGHRLEDIPGEKEFLFELGGEIVSTPSSGSARWASGAIAATIRTTPDEEPRQGVLVDAGVYGLALQCLDELAYGSLVSVDLASHAGWIELDGEVRYCRAESTSPMVFRIGIRIAPPSRIAQSRYMQLLERLSESA